MLSVVFKKVAARTSMSVLFLVLIGLLVAGCSGQEGLAEGDQAPDFVLEAADGSEFALEELVGEHPALLYFHMAMG